MILNKLFKKFLNLPKICYLLSVLIGLTFIFPAGINKVETNIERVGEYLSNVVKNDTVNSSIAGLLVEPKDGTKKSLENSYTEFLATYGVFRSSVAAYVATMNANHECYAQFKTGEYETTDTLSFVYIDNGSGSKEYKDHYKHEWYPFEFDYSGGHVKEWYKKASGLVWISQTHADKILESLGKEKTEENYKNEVLNSVIEIKTGSDKEHATVTKLYVDNIYCEYNYYYEPVHEVIGDFMILLGTVPNGLKKQSVYFMSEQSYKNEYFLKRTLNLYGHKDFKFDICRNNLKDNFKLNQEEFGSLYKEDRHFLSFICLAIAFIGCLTSIISNLVLNYLDTTPKMIAYYFVCFIPWLLFYSLNKIFKNAVIFSAYSTKIYLFFFIVIFVTTLLIFLIKNKIKKEIPKYEIDL